MRAFIVVVCVVVVGCDRPEVKPTKAAEKKKNEKKSDHPPFKTPKTAPVTEQTKAEKIRDVDKAAMDDLRSNRLDKAIDKLLSVEKEYRFHDDAEGLTEGEALAVAIIYARLGALAGLTNDVKIISYYGEKSQLYATKSGISYPTEFLRWSGEIARQTGAAYGK